MDANQVIMPAKQRLSCMPHRCDIILYCMQFQLEVFSAFFFPQNPCRTFKPIKIHSLWMIKFAEFLKEQKLERICRVHE